MSSTARLLSRKIVWAVVMPEDKYQAFVAEFKDPRFSLGQAQQHPDGVLISIYCPINKQSELQEYLREVIVAIGLSLSLDVS